MQPILLKNVHKTNKNNELKRHEFHMAKKNFLIVLFTLGIVVSRCGFSGKTQELFLKNGMRVVMDEMPRSRIVTVFMMVKAGSIYETETNRGISRLVENALFRESTHYRDIQEQIESYGGKYYSGTTQDYVYFSVTVRKPFLVPVLNIFADVIQNAQFSDSLISVTKSTLLRKMKQEQSNPSFQILSIFLQNIFHKHPYRFLPLGDTEHAQRFEVKDVVEYYTSLYTPENITVVVVGSGDPTLVMRILGDSVGLFARTSTRKYWDQEPNQTGSREVILHHSLPSHVAYVMVGWRAPSIQSDDTYGMDVVTISLGSGESSRLNTQIRDRMHSVYFIWADYRTPKEPGYFLITAVCDPSVADEVKRKILKEVDILRKDSITPKELEKAKMFLKSSEAYNRESTFETAYYLGYWSVVKDFRFFQTYLENINKVSLEDVQRVASSYLREDNYTSVILLPKGKEQENVHAVQRW